jgi:hypothetical protein
MGISIQDDKEKGKEICCILILGIIIGLWFAGKSKGESIVNEPFGALQQQHTLPVEKLR